MIERLKFYGTKHTKAISNLLSIYQGYVAFYYTLTLQTFYAFKYWCGRQIDFLCQLFGCQLRIFLQYSQYINIYFNKYEDTKKATRSLFSSKNLNYKNKEDYFIDNRNQIKKINENEILSEGLLTTISKNNYSNLSLEAPNHLLNKKTYINIKKEKGIKNNPANTGEINKSSIKVIEKDLENFQKIKLSSFQKSDIELNKRNYNIKNNILEKDLLKGNVIKKYLQSSKYSNKINEKLDYKDKNSLKSSFKDLYDSDNSKNGNNLELINECDLCAQINEEQGSLTWADFTPYKIEEGTLFVLCKLVPFGIYENEIEFHKEVGRYFNKNSNTAFITVGNLAYYIGKELEKNGFSVKHFDDNIETSRYILDNVNVGTTIFLKASRAMKFEEIIEGLKI